MENKKEKIITAIICSTIIYLLGSFTMCSFDISTWGFNDRITTAIFMGVSIFVSLFGYKI